MDAKLRGSSPSVSMTGDSSYRKMSIALGILFAGAAVCASLGSKYGFSCPSIKWNDIINTEGFHATSSVNDIENIEVVQEPTEKLFTKEELAKYGSDNLSGPVYLAIVGSVFDVTKGRRHYGKGGGYSFFAGIDGSRAFVTGKFDPAGLVDDVSDLEMQDYLGLESWLETYHKEYTYIGKVIGYFYDSRGNRTKGYQLYLEKLVEARKWKSNDEQELKLYPECNSRWTQETGAVMWCDQKSGGVSRSWIGYPRRFYKPGAKGTPRCACVQAKDLADPRFKEFKGCGPRDRTCKYLE